MEVLYHGIKTRYAYDSPLCCPHKLIMSLRSIGNNNMVSLNLLDHVINKLRT